MKTIFNTVDKNVQVEFVEKKSRFITNIKYVESEEKANLFLDQIKRKYLDARHNTFAYCINEEIPIYRFSDDGEPQGTAGNPILEVIKGNKLENVIIIVTRYFGGVLLGTGGLVKAYGSSAKLAVEEGGVTSKRLYVLFNVNINYKMLGKIEHFARNNGCLIENIDYLDNVQVTLSVLYEDYDKILNQLSDILSTKLDGIIIGKEWK